MPKVDIKYLWGIEDEKQGSSLTWSATLMNADIFWWIKVLFDYWMFQWWRNENSLNNKTDKEAINADYIVITHAHMDHIWRLPFLVKSWFKWKIIMSHLTKQLMLVMLSDYVKLTKNKIDSLKKENKSKWLRLRGYLKLIKLEEELNKNGLDKDYKIKKQNTLNKIVWNWSLNKLSRQAKYYLKKEKVRSEEDIETSLNDNIPTLLYDIDDIYKTMWMVKTLDVGNEVDLTDHIVITREDSEVIDKLPNIVKNEWYNRPIYVTPNIKLFIINKWKTILNDIFKISKENKQLRIKLRVALWIFHEEENYKGNTDFTKEEAKIFLDENSINSRKDIKNLEDNIPELPFTKEDAENASSLLKVVFNNPNEKVVESFKLSFVDAGHIEWSVQAIVTLVTKKVETNLWTKQWKKWKNNKWSIWYSSTIKEHQNFLFTWDLWKFTDPNISWIPEISDYKFDYVQCESTYATREHPNKKEEFSRFVSEINSAKGKVLIPAFSLQRTQEIIIELLENKLNNKKNIESYNKLKKEYRRYKREYDLLVNKWETINSDEETRKSTLFLKLWSISEKLEKINTDVFLGNLIIDSPLSKKITDIFLENIWEKYKLLDPLLQRELFWKEVLRSLEKWEYKNLYKDKRAKAKDIIISSGGMLQWWAIMNHLKEIIVDPSAKIIFTWYQSFWTIWQKILWWDKQVIIEWEIYDVKCEVVQIKWYSSHIWWPDIEKYVWEDLKYSKKAKLILNHGWELREVLAKTIRGVNSKIDVIVPSLYESVKVWL